MLNKILLAGAAIATLGVPALPMRNIMDEALVLMVMAAIITGMVITIGIATTTPFWMPL